MTCKACFHSNGTDSPLDDLEASCGCDCHYDFDEDVLDENDDWDDMSFPSTFGDKGN